MGQYCFARCRLSASVTCVGGWPPPGRAHGQSGGRHWTAGQYGYVPATRHVVLFLPTALAGKVKRSSVRLFVFTLSFEPTDL